jgi:hypothetical protein
VIIPPKKGKKEKRRKEKKKETKEKEKRKKKKRRKKEIDAFCKIAQEIKKALRGPGGSLFQGFFSNLFRLINFLFWIYNILFKTKHLQTITVKLTN